MITIPAIVPAAGKSRRMGQPKMLLPFDGQPLIGRVVTALRQGGADPVLVVTPPADVPEGPLVAEAASRAGATVIAPPSRPLEMRESVELALQRLAQDDPPRAFLLTPGDSPGVTSDIVHKIMERWSEAPEKIVIPTAGGRHTHPIILTWDLATKIASLPKHLGINALVAADPGRVVELEVSNPELATDLNTPEDLERWRAHLRPLPPLERRLTVRLFAIAKQKAGKSEIDLDLPLPATVGDLRLALAMQHPALAPLAPSVMIAVDSQYAADETLINPGSHVALIPPVSGG